MATAARLPTLMMLAPAARVIKPRRVGSTGLIADVFVGGVLSTLSAWVIGFLSLWLGLEPGRKYDPSPRLAFMVT
jgi:hypothetical protein